MKSTMILAAVALITTAPLGWADGLGTNAHSGIFAADGGFLSVGDEVERRGRGRGGDNASGGGRGNGGGHGGRPRIPGGSGCDDPGDILEHPECRV
jgi:hypothetical protein